VAVETATTHRMDWLVTEHGFNPTDAYCLVIARRGRWIPRGLRRAGSGCSGVATGRENEISMCGVLPALIVLETLRLLGRFRRAERAGYATSADVSGDTSRVVGHAGMLFG
jgi:hypothetical protein